MSGEAYLPYMDLQLCLNFLLTPVATFIVFSSTLVASWFADKVSGVPQVVPTNQELTWPGRCLCNMIQRKPGPLNRVGHFSFETFWWSPKIWSQCLYPTIRDFLKWYIDAVGVKGPGLTQVSFIFSDTQSGWGGGTWKQCFYSGLWRRRKRYEICFLQYGVLG